ncbi:MAG: hypothetical protein KDC80_01465 [Saprospiraceae bacterium]|nr:hypothetical protein [Saprospiraceae bacterium]
MRYLSTISFWGITIALSYSQPEISILGSADILQADLYNPARFQNRGWNIGLPALAYNFYHTGPGYRKIIDQSTGQPVLRLSNLRDGLKDENFLYTDFRFQTFKLKYGTKQWSFGLDHEIIFHSSIEYPGDLIRLYLDGNQQFIGQTIDIAPEGLIYSMNSYGFLISRSWSNMTLGIKPRILFGGQYGNVPLAKAELHTSDDVYQVTLNTDFRFDNVGLVRFENSNFLNYQIESFNQWSLFSSNLGAALDIGLQWHLSDAFDLGLSVVDWGRIRWDTDVRSYQSEQTMVYEGLEVVDLFEKEEIKIPDAIDSLRSIFQLEESQESLVFKLPTKFIAVATYQAGPGLELSLITYYQSGLSRPLVVGLQGLTGLSSHWKLGATLSNRYDEMNLGLMSVWTQSKWVAYLATDQVLTNLNPLQSNHFNLRVGLNLHLEGTTFD